MTPANKKRIRLLSFNIQAGASVRQLRHYVTRSIENVFPHPRKTQNLRDVAELARGYDLVALQEADDGSLRSGFLNQIEFLAEKGEFPYWSHQNNRRMAQVAASSNGLLTRYEPTRIIDHKLPGRIQGRGVLEVRFGTVERGLHVYIAHLSLTPRARRNQTAYIADVVGEHQHVVLMGDLNCLIDSPEIQTLFDRTQLIPHTESPRTFPAWKPGRAIDHILRSRSIDLISLNAVDVQMSDHLPLAAELDVPVSCFRTH